MDVSEARRGQGLEIDHKENARRNALALVAPTERADYHLATPPLATPGQALSESIDLIVVATGKREQLSDEFFQPSGAPGKTDRSSGEQIGLGNQSSALVGVGLIGRDVDGLLAHTLNETEADGRIFDQKSGRIIPPLELHDLFLQRFERKAATHHLKNVNNLIANQQNDTCGIIARFDFAQSNVPAHDDAVVRLRSNLIVGREPFSFDDRAAGGESAVTVLKRRLGPFHASVRSAHGRARARGGVATIQSGIGATSTEAIGL